MRVQTIKVGSHIEYSSKELLFLATSGQPYRGTLYISFESLGETIDLRDLKAYITSLRAKTLSSEDIAYNIYTTLNNTIKSKNLGVVVDLTARGGIQQRISFGEKFEPTFKANIFQV